MFRSFKYCKNYLNGEVDMARRVDNIDDMVAPLGEGGGGLDGDAALPLQLHAVHCCAHPVLTLHLYSSIIEWQFNIEITVFLICWRRFVFLLYAQFNH
jgi:hypothetical protein